MELKYCRKCCNEKPATTEYFYKKKGSLTSPCKACQSQVQAAYYSTHKPKVTKQKRQATKQRQAEYRRRNRALIKARLKANRSNLRLLALYAYGEQPPTCACCNTKHIQFLRLDYEKRQSHSLNNNHKVFQQLKNDDYPPGYIVLCHNCSYARQIYKSCPHTTASASTIT